MSKSGQNGKGRDPEKGYNHAKYRDRYDDIFRSKCAICGRPISDDELAADLGEGVCHADCRATDPEESS